MALTAGFNETQTKDYYQGTSLGLCTSSAGGEGSIPGGGTKIPHATGCSQKKKKKKNYYQIRRQETEIKKNTTSEQDRGRYES